TRTRHSIRGTLIPRTGADTAMYGRLLPGACRGRVARLPLRVERALDLEPRDYSRAHLSLTAGVEDLARTNRLQGDAKPAGAALGRGHGGDRWLPAGRAVPELAAAVDGARRPRHVLGRSPIRMAVHGCPRRRGAGLGPPRRRQDQDRRR